MKRNPKISDIKNFVMVLNTVCINILSSGTQTNCKEVSPPAQTTSQHNNVTSGNGTVIQQSHISSGVSTHQQNNNNKGESGVGVRRGKSNSESKAQAARNKHKNSQNKEKHGARTTSRSESSSVNAQSNSQSQITGQKDVRNFSADTNSEMLQKLGNKCKIEQQQQQLQPQQTSKTSKLVQSHEVKVNGTLQNGERRHSDSETDQQREGSTPASTISSTEDSNVIHQAEHLAESSEENNGAVLLGEFLTLVIIVIICMYIDSFMGQ